MKYYFPCVNGVSCFGGGKNVVAVVDDDGTPFVSSLGVRRFFSSSYSIKSIRK